VISLGTIETHTVLALTTFQQSLGGRAADTDWAKNLVEHLRSKLTIRGARKADRRLEPVQPTVISEPAVRRCWLKGKAPNGVDISFPDHRNRRS